MVRTGLAAIAALVLAACSGGGDGAANPSTGAANAVSAEFSSTLNGQELMAHVIDHSAFEIWTRQGWVYNADGVEELFPQDEEGWLEAENASATLAELANVLLLPGRIPADGADDWVRYAHELNRTSLAAMQTAEAQDKEAFFDAGGEIYVVCRSCHEKFVIGDIE